MLFLFLSTYVCSTVAFASLFFLFGDDCFILEPGTQFGFAPMFWISVHIFSTIGFGNIAPRQTCFGAQLIVLLESFCALLVVAAISGYVVKLFLRPLSAVRFSSKVLLNHGRRRVDYSSDEVDGGDSDGTPPSSGTATPVFSKAVPRHYRRLSHTAGLSQALQCRYVTFRMVRQGRVQLRDVRVNMQAQYWVAGATAFGDRDSHKGRVCNLELEQSYFTTLEQLQVWHRIDEKSPLWRMRDSLDKYIDSFEVSVSAYDVASLQTVMFFKR